MLKLPRNYGYRNLVIIIIIIIICLTSTLQNHIIFYFRFLWNLTRKQKRKRKKGTTSQDQLLIRETIKSFQSLLLHPNWRSDREKFHLGEKKKTAKNSRNLKLFNGFFFFLFFLLGGKNLTSKAILTQML